MYLVQKLLLAFISLPSHDGHICFYGADSVCNYTVSFQYVKRDKMHEIECCVDRVQAYSINGAMESIT